MENFMERGYWLHSWFQRSCMMKISEYSEVSMKMGTIIQVNPKYITKKDWDIPSFCHMLWLNSNHNAPIEWYIPIRETGKITITKSVKLHEVKAEDRIYPIFEPFFPTRILRWLNLLVMKCCSILREPSRNSFQSIKRCSISYGIS